MAKWFLCLHRIEKQWRRIENGGVSLGTCLRITNWIVERSQCESKVTVARWKQMLFLGTSQRLFSNILQHIPWLFPSQAEGASSQIFSSDYNSDFLPHIFQGCPRPRWRLMLIISPCLLVLIFLSTSPLSSPAGGAFTGTSSCSCRQWFKGGVVTRGGVVVVVVVEVQQQT